MASFRYGFQNLRRVAMSTGDNLDARAKMLAASCMGGIAFSNCALGIVHSIAHLRRGYGVPTDWPTPSSCPTG